MHLDEIDEELFKQILNEFLEKHENGEQILKDVHAMYLKIRRKIFVRHYPSHHIIKYLLIDKLETPIEKGGYMGLPIKEIANREGLSKSGAYAVINTWMKEKRCKAKGKPY